MKSIFSVLVLTILASLSVIGQAPNEGQSPRGGMSIGPARFELEMDPGTETTVVLNLDYRNLDLSARPARIIASLSDWTITPDGRVEYFPANSRPDSASPWLIYSPGDAAVLPGTTHQIRVTVSVPTNATPGDHLTALIIEQRPETLKPQPNVRQVIVKYRMASVFYIKVKNLTRKGDFGDLLAESTSEGITVTPTLRNEGNSMVRPLGSLKVLDETGKVVAEMPELEMLPVLAGSEIRQPIHLAESLPVGSYTVKYRVDFQDGKAAVDGVTDLLVKPAVRQIAATGTPPKRP